MTIFILVDWLRPYSHDFYVAKGLVSLVGTMLLTWHMALTWHEVRRWSQRLRYLALLAAGALLTMASIEQVHDDALVNVRNVAAFGVSLLILVASAVSLCADRQRFSH